MQNVGLLSSTLQSSPPLLLASVTGRVTYSKAGPIVSSNAVDSNQYAEQTERLGSPPVHSIFFPVSGKRPYLTVVMGTGSSRNQVTKETVPKPASPAGDSSDVGIARERHRPVRQSTIEKIVTETGAEVGKVYRDPDDLLDVSSVHNDDALEDIHDLEQTFDSLGIPSSSNLSSDQFSNRITDRHSQERDLAPLKTKLSVSDVIIPASQNSPQRESGAEDTAAAVGWSGVRSTSGPQARLDIPPTSLVYNNNHNCTKSAPTKLPWSLPEPANPPDEWIYRKVRQFLYCIHTFIHSFVRCKFIQIY